MAFTRRTLLMGTAVAGAAAGVAGCFHRRSAWEFFTDAEARTLAALSDQIIPADEFPSASQSGAVAFIDRQLIRHYAPHQPAYRDGLARLDNLSRARFGAEFATLSTDHQSQIAHAVARDDPDFFALVRDHTMQGYYGSPRHGGNRDAASWRMLGLDEAPLRGRAQYDFTALDPTTGKHS